MCTGGRRTLASHYEVTPLSLSTPSSQVKAQPDPTHSSCECLAATRPKRCSSPESTTEGGEGSDMFSRGRVCCGSSCLGGERERRLSDGGGGGFSFLFVSVAGSGLVWLTRKCWAENTENSLCRVDTHTHTHTHGESVLCWKGRWAGHLFDSCLWSFTPGRDDNNQKLPWRRIFCESDAWLQGDTKRTVVNNSIHVQVLATVPSFND